jgi:hypothetical protein
MKPAPMLDRKEADGPALIDNHPATRAWCKLANREIRPDNIEILQEDARRPDDLYRPAEKASVYRLIGVCPDGANVIAKKCHSAAASCEWSIYSNILRHLPVSMLQYYGLVADENEKFCWLLLEDAGEDQYIAELEEHRILAGHWLGMMNISASQIDAAARLPHMGSRFYLERLIASRQTIHEVVGTWDLARSDAAVLQAVICHCDVLEKQWGGIEEFCKHMPQTLVHGDLAFQNARVRCGPAGQRLLIMDWDGAGWGIPAVDLAQFVGVSLSPDLHSYHSAVCSGWPGLRFVDIENLAAFGQLFRLINSLVWANWGYNPDSSEWYVEELTWCEQGLADWLRSVSA